MYSNRCLQFECLFRLKNLSLSQIIHVASDHLPSGEPMPPLKVTLLIEALTSGHIAASISEFPDCRVEAANRESAIAQLQAAFLERLNYMEAIAWTVPVQPAAPKWLQFAGAFENDTDFQVIVAALHDERTSEDESEVDPAYYA